MRTMVLAVVGILFLSTQSCNSPSGAAGQKEPIIATLKGQRTLVLPEQLENALKREAPGLRVPTPSDMTGSWKANIEQDWLPFAAWGDFDGNGLTDVALILLGEGLWKLVIFRQIEIGNYKALDTIGAKAGSQSGDPRAWQIGLARKGSEYSEETWSDDGEYVGARKMQLSFDGIHVRQGSERDFILHWVENQFKSIESPNE